MAARPANPPPTTRIVGKGCFGIMKRSRYVISPQKGSGRSVSVAVTVQTVRTFEPEGNETLHVL